MLDAALEWMGVRPRPYRALVRALLLMDFRCQGYGRATATKPGELLPPFFWVVSQFLFTSAVLSCLLFARADVWAFALVHLAGSMLLAFSAIVVEFNEVVLDLGDRDVVGHRPVPGRTYAAARLTNLAFYVAILTLASNLFPAIVGTGLRDGGAWFLPAYLAASAMGNAWAVGAAILAYGLAPGRGDRRALKDTLAWTQILLALVAFYGAQMVLRDPEKKLEVFLATPPEWFRWLPPAWLADLVVRGRQLSAGWGAATLGTALLGVWVLRSLVRYYADTQPVAAAEPAPDRTRRPRPLPGPWVRRLAGSRAQAASLALCLRMLARDHDLRMRTLPTLATAAAFLAFGLFAGQAGDPFVGDPSASVLSIVVVQLVVLAVPSILHNMRFGRDHAASWLLRTAPSAARHGESARLAACWTIILPAFLVVWAGFSIGWGSPGHAGIVCALGWIEACALAHWSVRAIRLDVPFSEPAARGAVLGPIAPFLAAAGTVGIAAGAAMHSACRSGVLLVGYSVAVVAGWWAARWFARAGHA